MKAIIEKSENGGVSIYAPDIEGVYGFGMTEQDAKSDFLEVLEEQVEYYREKHGSRPRWYTDCSNIEYVYDLSGFFEAFPFINASKFAEALGVNPSLMRKYKGKLAGASERQLQAIQQRYDELVRRMQLVRF